MPLLRMNSVTLIENLLQFVGNKAKERISKRVFKENKTSQIFRKTSISYPLKRTRTCTYQGVRNVNFLENLVSFGFLEIFYDRCVYQWGNKCSFFRKLGVFCFLERPVLRFALLLYYSRIYSFLFNLSRLNPF